MIGLVWHVWLASVGLVGLVSLAGLVRKRFCQKKGWKKDIGEKKLLSRRKKLLSKFCAKNILI